MSSIKKTLALLFIALVVVSAIQVDQVEAGQKSDLIFVKGKFIKKDKKGVIVVEERSPMGCRR